MTVKLRSHAWVYVVIAVVIVVLMDVGVARFHEAKQSRAARAKAQEYIAKLEAAGFTAPKEETVVRLFGTDGGAVMEEHPGAALIKYQYFSQLGTAGPAGRSIILDTHFLEAERIFLSVYAPRKLAEFDAYVKTLKLGDTTTDQ